MNNKVIWISLNTQLKFLIKGFISQADVSSPPVHSRHLILPVSNGRENKVNLVNNE